MIHGKLTDIATILKMKLRSWTESGRLVSFAAAIAFMMTNCVMSSAADYSFSRISLEDGLSQSYVRAILRDSSGFLWIGTRMGLNRYDYRRIEAYYSDADDALSLTGDDIRLLFEDAEGKIWASAEFGTSIFDSRVGNFTQVTVDGSMLNIRSFLPVDGGLMLGGAGTLFSYSYATDEVKPIPTTGGSTMYYNAILELSSERYLLSTRWDGLWEYDNSTGQVTRLEVAAGSKNIAAVAIGADGNLWLSRYGLGLDCYTTDMQLIAHYDQANSDLSSDVILTLVQNGENLWIGTDGGGISILNLSTGEFSRINSQPDGFPENSITTLYKDEYGNMFAGTVHSGAVCLQKVPMHTYTRTGLGTVTSIVEDESGRVWVGGDGGGVSVFNPVTRRFTNFPSTEGMKITSVADIGESLVLADFSRGLYLMSKRSGDLRKLPFSQSEAGKRIASKGLHIELLRGEGSEVYVFADEIYTLNIRTGEYAQATIPASDNREGRLSLFYSDAKGVMVFDLHSIYRFDFASKAVTVVATFGSTNSITAAQYDGGSEVYVATNTGMMKLNTSAGTASPTNLGPRHGVNTCLLDGNDLWIGAGGALVLHKVADGKTIIFNKTDGVEPNEFIARSTLLTDEYIYFGGATGLLCIDKGALSEARKENSPISISLSGIEIDGVSALADVKKGHIDIPNSHSTIHIDIIEKEKDLMRQHVFRYYIEGATTNVVESTDRTLPLNILPDGVYRIRVSCRDALGEWIEPIELITLNVLKPWWRTTWAISGYIVLLLLVWLITVYLTSLRRKRQLDKEMADFKQQQLEREVDFLINVSHEMRTPLTLIYAPLKLLIARLKREKCNPTVIDDLDVIYRNTQKMRDVINMTLDLRRLEMGHTGLNITAVNFNEWIRGLAGDFSTEFRNRRIELSFELDDRIGEINLDAEKTATVVSNFIMNALKYSPPKSGTIISTSLQGKYVLVSVTDSGRGLDTVDMDRLFSKFYQGKGAVFGSGLGLSYSKSLIELQSGHIGAYDNDGMPGATFWFELPVDAECTSTTSASTKTDEEEKTASDLAVDIPAGSAMGKVSTANLSVIVVEDDMELCQFIASNLRAEYAKVYTVYNGRDAMMLIRNQLPDIIISDVMLPSISGLEICRLVKTSEQLRHIPIILLTARIDEASMQAGYDQGADSYLSKPFDMDILKTRCRNLLYSREVIRDRYINSEDKSSRSSNRRGQKMSNASETFLKKIYDLVEQNISSADFNIDDIVKHLYMSRASVQNKFRELTGQNLGTYITNYRLERAKEYLSAGEMSMNDISYALGFRSQRYFSTFFKKNTGVTPSEWRKSNNVATDSVDEPQQQS